MHQGLGASVHDDASTTAQVRSPSQSSANPPPQALLLLQHSLDHVGALHLLLLEVQLGTPGAGAGVRMHCAVTSEACDQAPAALAPQAEASPHDVVQRPADGGDHDVQGVERLEHDEGQERNKACTGW